MINPDELLFTVDEDNNPIDPKPRDFVHRNGYWHRNSHVWIVNDQKQILAQQRSLLKVHSAGKWNAFFGGHVPPETDYISHAIVELEEELGLVVSPTQLKEMFIYKREDGREFEAVFKFKWNDDLSVLRLEEDEIDQVRWFSIPDLKREYLLNSDNWGIMGYEEKLFGLLFK